MRWRGLQSLQSCPLVLIDIGMKMKRAVCSPARSTSEQNAGKDVPTCLWVCPEGANFDSTCGYSTIRIDLSLRLSAEGRETTEQLTTTARYGSLNFWLFCWVFTSIPDSQQPYPGCLPKSARVLSYSHANGNVRTRSIEGSFVEIGGKCTHE